MRSQPYQILNEKRLFHFLCETSACLRLHSLKFSLLSVHFYRKTGPRAIYPKNYCIFFCDIVVWKRHGVDVYLKHEHFSEFYILLGEISCKENRLADSLIYCYCSASSWLMNILTIISLKVTNKSQHNILKLVEMKENYLFLR